MPPSRRPGLSALLVAGAVVLLVSIVIGQKLGDRVLLQTERRTMTVGSQVTAVPEADSGNHGELKNWKRLQVVSACQFIPRDANGNAIGAQRTHLHMDNWRWRVTADENTLLNVIELMHGGAVSTLEVPCILGEDMYDALKTARQRLADAIAGTTDSRLNDVWNALFDMEALIVANCLFVEVLNPLVAFPGPMQYGAPNIQPPGNPAATVIFGSQGSAVAGIIDTVENPCCCKLLVDLEWIAIRQGLVGQTPTLPTF